MEIKMEEIWKPVKGYENRYLVSNYGRFFSLHMQRIMKQQHDKDGYCLICIGRKIRRAHRVVAEAFIDNQENLPQINHINGDKSDNRIENLEWCTQSYNMKHSFDKLDNKIWNKNVPMSEEQKQKLSQAKKGKHILGMNGNAKKVLCIETGEIFSCAREADIKIGVVKGCVAHCAKGYTKTAGGLHWQYV